MNMSLKNDIQIQLPPPSAEEIEQSQPLMAIICEKIRSNDGKISFAEYMDIVLYAPNHGYYTSKKAIFGDLGDFVTAPELTPLFSRCIARQIKQVLNDLDDTADILEFGAGAGTMACDILMELEKLHKLPNRYFISEISPSLQQRQYDRISTYAPHLIDKVKWVDTIPEEFTGIILGNELLDALPTHRIRFDKHNAEHKELFVTFKDEQLQWLADEPSSELLNSEVKQLFIRQQQNISTADNYESEVNIANDDWIRMLAKNLKKGIILLIDYGYAEEEYYRPERHEGSLMCHYKHRAHNNPLTHVGLQDITSHVNFTQIAETAFDNGFDIMGFTNQTYFLLGCGLESLLEEIDVNDTKLFISETQPVKQLILPDEMGDLFKVIGLSKNMTMDLIGFSAKNMLERL